MLARSKTHLEAYNIKGKEHTEEMIRYMNELFENKGVEIRSVIITNVILDEEVARPLEEKTTYASLKTLERKKQSFELRVLNDEQEIDLLQQTKEEERYSENEKANKLKADIEKEHDKIKAETSKMIAEIEENTIAEVNKIKADAELEAQEIQSETKLIRAKIMADGRAKT